MKKITAVLLFAFCSIAAIAQDTSKVKKDIPKRDTVKIPVVYLQKTDSQAVTVILCDRGGKVKWKPGFILRTGYKTNTGDWGAAPAVRLIDPRGKSFVEKVISVN